MDKLSRYKYELSENTESWKIEYNNLVDEIDFQNTALGISTSGLSVDESINLCMNISTLPTSISQQVDRDVFKGMIVNLQAYDLISESHISIYSIIDFTSYDRSCLEILTATANARWASGRQITYPISILSKDIVKSEAELLSMIKLHLDAFQMQLRRSFIKHNMKTQRGLQRLKSILTEKALKVAVAFKVAI